MNPDLPKLQVRMVGTVKKADGTVKTEPPKKDEDDDGART